MRRNGFCSRGITPSPISALTSDTRAWDRSASSFVRKRGCHPRHFDGRRASALEDLLLTGRSTTYLRATNLFSPAFEYRSSRKSQESRSTAPWNAVASEHWRKHDSATLAHDDLRF